MLCGLACSSGRDFQRPTAGSGGMSGTGTEEGGAGDSAMAGGADGDAGASHSNGGTAAGAAGNGGAPTPPDDCEMDPCLNGGVCSNKEEGAVCACPPEYDGDFCEKSVDDCADEPCQNGGTCVDGDNEYSCTCTSRFTGPTCQYLEAKLVPSDFQGGGWATQATALSNDGNVLIFNGSKGDDRLAGRLVGFSSANVLVTNGSAFGIDADGGNVTGSLNTGALDEAFKMVGAVTNMLDLSPLGWDEARTTGTDVSADGKVVVGTLSQGGGVGPFFCQLGQACRAVPVDETRWITNVPAAVSGDGSIVVGSVVPGDPTTAPYFAWRWVTSASKATALTVPSSAWAVPRATSISRNGSVIIGNADINGIPHAVRWSGASLTPTDLGEGEARGTNEDGSVIVGTDGSTAVVWLGTTRQTVASLIGSNPDLADVSLKQAVAVSDDGKVVAVTGSLRGTDQALVVRLP